MKIVDCLPLMTQMYLSRTVDSILKEDVPRGDEERLREQIRQNAKELADPDRVHEALREETLVRAQRILMEAILDSLLLCPDMACDEDGLFEQVRAFEQEVIEAARDPDAFADSDDHALEAYPKRTALGPTIRADISGPCKLCYPSQVATREASEAHLRS